MRLYSGKILEITFIFSPQKKVLEEIKKYLFLYTQNRKQKAENSIKPLVVVTPNPEQVVYAHRHSSFMEMLNRADVSLPDGIGIVYASRFLPNHDAMGKKRILERRIAGSEFMLDLVALAAKNRVRIGLIGGFDGLAVEALERLQHTYPRLEGWATDGPVMTVVADGAVTVQDEQEEYLTALADRIRKQNTGLVFVGLGAPKQEYLIERLTTKTGGPRVFMAVGGSLDYIAGRVQRAPVFIRLIGFEWFWRLLREPWRLKRQTALIRFVWLVIRAAIRT